MFDPRAIATLGIGYDAQSVARLGLWPSDETAPPPGGGVGTILRPVRREPYRSAFAAVDGAGAAVGAGVCRAGGGAQVVVDAAATPAWGGAVRAGGWGVAGVPVAASGIAAGPVSALAGAGAAIGGAAALVRASTVSARGVQNLSDEELTMLLLSLEV